MKRSYYETPKSTKLMRLLWKAAGGDKYLLNKATYADQVKYMCLGGVVVATGAMAALAGGYAFYTIFSPRGNAIDSVKQKYAALGQEVVNKMTEEALANLHIQEIIIPIVSILFGIIWGLIIFNIDRFIVTSTGKGDGTEAITWQEFKTAIPRLLMGMIIAITISKPVEIRMFKSEIDAKLYEKQLELQKEYEKRTNANFEERLKVVESDLGEISEKRQDLIERIKTAERNMQDNLMGKVPGISAGNGRLTKAIQSHIEALNIELKRFDEINSEKLNEAQKRRKEILVEKNVALAENVEVANGLDGLLERIKLAHEIAGWAISLFITLLFMAIELTPIFFKLMLIKTPYDYMDENVKELIKAENGIEVRYNFYTDKEGQERHKVIYHQADKLIHEQSVVIAAQKELTEEALKAYTEQQKEVIRQNPQQYISESIPDETAE